MVVKASRFPCPSKVKLFTIGHLLRMISINPKIYRAARILANLLVAGSMVLGRAVVQAYQKAIQNANKTGVAQEALNNMQRVRKTMTEQEARLILGIGEKTTWEEILQKYDALFEKNAKNGSFYLQSKVHRAKECLEAAYQSKGGQPS